MNINTVDLNEDPSAFQKHMGYRLIRFERDYAELDMPIAPFLMNRRGIPHGGAYSALLDTAMGFAGSFAGEGAEPNRALTLNLSVNFLAQSTGNTLIARAKRVGGGFKTYFAEATLHDDTGTLIATATGVFKVQKPASV